MMVRSMSDFIRIYCQSQDFINTQLISIEIILDSVFSLTKYISSFIKSYFHCTTLINSIVTCTL